MFPIQILQKHIAIPSASTILGNIIVPATYRGGETAGDVGFVDDGGDGCEVSADCEEDGAGAGETVGWLVVSLVCRDGDGRVMGVIGKGKQTDVTLASHS